MAIFRFYIKAPDQARDLFMAWKNGLGTPQKREPTYLEFGESFTVELDTDDQTWRLVKLSE